MKYPEISLLLLGSLLLNGCGGSPETKTTVPPTSTPNPGVMNLNIPNETCPFPQITARSGDRVSFNIDGVTGRDCYVTASNYNLTLTQCTIPDYTDVDWNGILEGKYTSLGREGNAVCLKRLYFFDYRSLEEQHRK